MTTASPTNPAGLDRSGMLATVRAAPDDWRQATRIADDSDLTVPADARAVIVVGMGGSGVAADVATTLSDRAGSVPVVGVKDYRLPAWADERTPVVAVSYSGNTEETLATLDAATERGCPMLGITSGGAVAERLGRVGAPIAMLPGGRQPRASMAYLAAPLLVALERGGHLPGAAADLAEVPQHVHRCMDDWGNAPRDVAAALVERVPLFVGGAGIGAVVVERARKQCNENAEVVAVASVLPEADHNEIVGWGGGPDVPFGLVEVVDIQEHARTAARFDITRTVAGDGMTFVHRLVLSGPSDLARLVAGVQFVDLVSVHLALLLDVDPTPVTRIDTLKQRLAER